MTREEMNAEASKMGIKNPESFNTKADLEAAIRDHLDAAPAPEEPVLTPVEEPVEEVVAPAPSPAANEGSEIAKAIAEGMKNVGKGTPIRISADHSVQSRFSVVRSKTTGEVMIRENKTGVVSKVQLRSLEEQEAAIQKEEVEEI